MFENVYIGSDAKETEEGKAENLIRELYSKLTEEPGLLPNEFYAKISGRRR